MKRRPDRLLPRRPRIDDAGDVGQESGGDADTQDHTQRMEESDQERRPVVLHSTGQCNRMSLEIPAEMYRAASQGFRISLEIQGDLYCSSGQGYHNRGLRSPGALYRSPTEPDLRSPGATVRGSSAPGYNRDLRSPGAPYRSSTSQGNSRGPQGRGQKLPEVSPGSEALGLGKGRETPGELRRQGLRKIKEKAEALRGSKGQGNGKNKKAGAALRGSEGTWKIKEKTEALRGSEAQGQGHRNIKGEVETLHSNEGQAQGNKKGQVTPEALHGSDGQGLGQETSGALHGNEGTSIPPPPAPPSKVKEGTFVKETHGALQDSEARGHGKSQVTPEALHGSESKGRVKCQDIPKASHGDEGQGHRQGQVPPGALHGSEAQGHGKGQDTTGALHGSETQGHGKVKNTPEAVHGSMGQGQSGGQEKLAELHSSDAQAEGQRCHEAPGTSHVSEGQGRGRGQATPGESLSCEAQGHEKHQFTSGALHGSEGQGRVKCQDIPKASHGDEGQGHRQGQVTPGALHGSEAQVHGKGQDTPGALHGSETQGHEKVKNTPEAVHGSKGQGQSGGQEKLEELHSSDAQTEGQRCQETPETSHVSEGQGRGRGQVTPGESLSSEGQGPEGDQGSAAGGQGHEPQNSPSPVRPLTRPPTPVPAQLTPSASRESQRSYAPVSNKNQENYISQQLKHWAEDRTLRNRPAFVVFSPGFAGTPTVFSRTDVYTLAKRYAFRVVKKVVESFGLCEVCVINTLPSSPERVITDLGALLTGAVLVDGPRNIQGWKTFDTNFQGLEGRKVIIVAKGSELEQYMTSHPQDLHLVRDAVVERVSPMVTYSELEVGLLTLLDQMDPTEELEMCRDPEDHMLVAWRSHLYHDETTQELIGYHRRGLETLGDQMRGVLPFDPRHDTFFNPNDPDVPWGFPIAYLDSGVTTALCNKFLARRDRSDVAAAASGYARILHDEDFGVFVDWPWLARETSVLAWIDSEALHDLYVRDRTVKSRVRMTTRRFDVRFSILALCGVTSERLVRPMSLMTKKLVGVYGGVETGIISMNAFLSHALLRYDPSEVGDRLNGVQVQLVNPLDGDKAVGSKASMHAPAELRVRNKLLGLRKRLPAGGDRWQQVPAEEWRSTQDLAYLGEGKQLHVVARVPWKMWREQGLGTVHVSVVEKGCAREGEFQDVVFLELVYKDVTDPDQVHPCTEVVACVVPHPKLAANSLCPKERFEILQSYKQLDLHAFVHAKKLVLFDELPRIDQGPHSGPMEPRQHYYSHTSGTRSSLSMVSEDAEGPPPLNRLLIALAALQACAQRLDCVLGPLKNYKIRSHQRGPPKLCIA